jgi:hypothetical protein
MYNAPLPGSKKQKSGSSSSSSGGGSSSGIVVFKTLEAANARAAQVWKYLQANPPFDSEADPVEGEEVDTAAEQGPDAFKTVTADGRAQWQRQQRYYFDPHNPRDLQNLVASTLTVEVVSASRG